MPYRYEIKYSPLKYIETTERGLVVITVNEADGGRYDCYLGGSLLCSYSITVDAHRYDIEDKTVSTVFTLPLSQNVLAELIYHFVFILYFVC